jgi:hypothetical protein
LKIEPLDAPFEARGPRAIFLLMTDKRLPRPRDPVQLGKLIGDILTGQVEDHAPAIPPDPNKDPAAVALGRKGGLKGGRARANSLSPSERTKIAQDAAKKRWGDKE